MPQLFDLRSYASSIFSFPSFWNSLRSYYLCIPSIRVDILLLEKGATSQDKLASTLPSSTLSAKVSLRLRPKAVCSHGVLCSRSTAIGACSDICSLYIEQKKKCIRARLVVLVLFFTGVEFSALGFRLGRTATGSGTPRQS